MHTKTPPTDIYTLPDLPYSFDALAPWCPAETLKVHHGKHHATYVKEANSLAKLLGAADASDEVNVGALRTAFAFNLGGHVLHSLFWISVAPESTQPSAALTARLAANFGSLERFKTLFTSACVKVQGSGWGVLMGDPTTGELSIGSILNHTNSIIPGFKPLAVIDVWEHAYYLSHKNDRASWVKAAIDHLNWEGLEQRCSGV